MARNLSALSARSAMSRVMQAPADPSPIDPDLLMMAYRSGIFPMSDARDDPEIFWVEPHRRAYFRLMAFAVRARWHGPCGAGASPSPAMPILQRC